MSSTGSDPHRERAARLQERFDFYLIALTFTVLGLSVQTAKFEASRITSALELASWLLLLASGVIGISRLEWLPPLHELFARKSDVDSSLKLREAERVMGVQINRVLGQSKPPASADELRKAAAETENQTTKLRESLVRKYLWQRRLLVFGLAGLVASRGLNPFFGLFGYQLK